MEETRRCRRLRWARSSGVFLCFVSLDAQRNEGVERGRNPATLWFLNPQKPGTAPVRGQSRFYFVLTHPPRMTQPGWRGVLQGFEEKCLSAASFFLRCKTEQNGGNPPLPKATVGKEAGRISLLRFFGRTKK